MVRDYWEEVGVKVAVKVEQRNFFATRINANDAEVMTWFMGVSSEFSLHRYPLLFRPAWAMGNGTPWLTWWNTKGEQGEEPPEEIKKLFEACAELTATFSGSEEYMRWGKEVLTMNVTNLDILGTVGMAPSPSIVKNGLRNIPEEGINGASDYSNYAPYQADTWFWKK